MVAGLIASLVGGTVYTRVEGTEVDVKRLNIEPDPTVIYDMNGNVMARFKREQKDVTAYEEIPIEVIQAVVSTEDRGFFEHPGINVKAITRAAYAIVQADGDIVQGGSTLTQQLVKTIYLTNEKKLERKIKEAVLATSLEGQMSKEEIVSNYLNHIFYGNQAYGIRSAVETYFDQTLEEFKEGDRIDRIAKAALLGGMPQLPSLHNPYLNPEAAKQRRDTVLANMWTVGYITEDEYKQAKTKPFLTLDKPNVEHEDEKIKYGEVVTYVLDEVQKVLQTDEEGAKFSGMEIYTSFDPKAYEILRKSFEKTELFPPNSGNGTMVQSTASIVNPKNGEIIAMTGGREAPNFADLNRAYASKRQPGSSFKSIISYAPALESGKFHPWSLLLDQAGHTFPGNYTPKNYSGGGNGKMTMVAALTASQNIPAVYLLQQTGIDYAIKFGEKLGIEFTDADRYLPIALGGLSKGVSTLQMADAYQGFANGGFRVPAHIIKRMVNPQGEVVYEADNKLTENYRVMKPQTSQYMRYMLQNAVRSGTGTQANITNEIVGGKTGTTDKNKDMWFTGFTNAFTMSIWMGYDNPEPVSGGSWMAARMFATIGEDLAKLYPDGDAKYETPKQVKPEVLEVKLSAKLNESDHSVSLSWESEKDTTYAVYRNNKVIAEKLSDNSYIDKKLKEGEKYEYHVVGYNDYTDFETFTTNSVTIEIKKPIEPPTSAKINSTDVTVNSVALTWSEVEGATNYIITRDGKQIYKGSKLTYTEEGLSEGTLYHYELIVQGEGGNSSPTSINVTTKTLVPETPSEPETPDTEETIPVEQEGSTE